MHVAAEGPTPPRPAQQYPMSHMAPLPHPTLLGSLTY